MHSLAGRSHRMLAREGTNHPRRWAERSGKPDKTSGGRTRYNARFKSVPTSRTTEAQQNKKQGRALLSCWYAAFSAAVGAQALQTQVWRLQRHDGRFGIKRVNSKAFGDNLGVKDAQILQQQVLRHLAQVILAARHAMAALSGQPTQTEFWRGDAKLTSACAQSLVAAPLGPASFW